MPLAAQRANHRYQTPLLVLLVQCCMWWMLSQPVFCWPRVLSARRLLSNLHCVGSLSDVARNASSLKYLGDPDLMQPQQPLPASDIVSEGVQEHLAALRRAMLDHGGLGIAAPQVGWWVRAMCFGGGSGASRYPNVEPVDFQFWINPHLTWASNDTSWMWEGCLSVPGMRGWVERPREVRMEGFDEHGQPLRAHLTGLAARIAQHELDHLDGILFPSRVAHTKFLVPQTVFDNKESWDANWPSPGSRSTKAGSLSLEM
eukprot:TRINITY_DN42805_c0_g1_i1.p1 TRINITY_DN42805_c0_g1~~TRINITY_DN42805_c0_g1_i1.p1  ORF type:complete len:258 (-),score=36.85 TRINITY_DN42805_c0_g1_i1:61-834(-)